MIVQRLVDFEGWSRAGGAYAQRIYHVTANTQLRFNTTLPPLKTLQLQQAPNRQELILSFVPPSFSWLLFSHLPVCLSVCLSVTCVFLSFRLCFFQFQVQVIRDAIAAQLRRNFKSRLRCGRLPFPDISPSPPTCGSAAPIPDSSSATAAAPTDAAAPAGSAAAPARVPSPFGVSAGKQSDKSETISIDN